MDDDDVIHKAAFVGVMVTFLVLALVLNVALIVFVLWPLHRPAAIWPFHRLRALCPSNKMLVEMEQSPKHVLMVGVCLAQLMTALLHHLPILHFHQARSGTQPPPALCSSLVLAELAAFLFPTITRLLVAAALAAALLTSPKIATLWSSGDVMRGRMTSLLPLAAAVVYALGVVVPVFFFLYLDSPTQPCYPGEGILKYTTDPFDGKALSVVSYVIPAVVIAASLAACVALHFICSPEAGTAEDKFPTKSLYFASTSSSVKDSSSLARAADVWRRPDHRTTSSSDSQASHKRCWAFPYDTAAVAFCVTLLELLFCVRQFAYWDQAKGDQRLFTRKEWVQLWAVDRVLSLLSLSCVPVCWFFDPYIRAVFSPRFNLIRSVKSSTASTKNGEVARQWSEYITTNPSSSDVSVVGGGGKSGLIFTLNNTYKDPPRNNATTGVEEEEQVYQNMSHHDDWERARPLETSPKTRDGERIYSSSVSSILPRINGSETPDNLFGLYDFMEDVSVGISQKEVPRSRTEWEWGNDDDFRQVPASEEDDDATADDFDDAINGERTATKQLRKQDSTPAGGRSQKHVVQDLRQRLADPVHTAQPCKGQFEMTSPDTQHKVMASHLQPRQANTQRNNTMTSHMEQSKASLPQKQRSSLYNQRDLDADSVPGKHAIPVADKGIYKDKAIQFPKRENRGIDQDEQYNYSTTVTSMPAQPASHFSCFQDARQNSNWASEHLERSVLDTGKDQASRTGNLYQTATRKKAEPGTQQSLSEYSARGINACQQEKRLAAFDEFPSDNGQGGQVYFIPRRGPESLPHQSIQGQQPRPILAKVETGGPVSNMQYRIQEHVPPSLPSQTSSYQVQRSSHSTESQGRQEQKYPRPQAGASAKPLARENPPFVSGDFSVPFFQYQEARFARPQNSSGNIHQHAQSKGSAFSVTQAVCPTTPPHQQPSFVASAGHRLLHDLNTPHAQSGIWYQDQTKKQNEVAATKDGIRNYENQAVVERFSENKQQKTEEFSRVHANQAPYMKYPHDPYSVPTERGYGDSQRVTRNDKWLSSSATNTNLGSWEESRSGNMRVRLEDNVLAHHEQYGYRQQHPQTESWHQNVWSSRTQPSLRPSDNLCSKRGTDDNYRGVTTARHMGLPELARSDQGRRQPHSQPPTFQTVNHYDPRQPVAVNHYGPQQSMMNLAWKGEEGYSPESQC